MIVEFPAATCIAHATATIKTRIGRARARLIASCGTPSSSHFTVLSGKTTITGVGFFDFQHPQAGVAPNGIELNPALTFTGGCT